VAAAWYDTYLRQLSAVLEEREDAASVVQANIVTRLAEEIRAMSWASSCGYLLPSMTLGASVIEIAYTSAYISDSESRAETWRRHKVMHQAPWKVAELVTGVVLKRNGSRELAKNMYGHYQALCTGKHHNPVFTLELPSAASGERHLVEIDPQISRRWNSLAGVMVLVLKHVVDALDDLCGTELVPEALGARRDLGRRRWAAATRSLGLK
jgi:hypothetical protein